jgi:hypothetical protein
MGDTILRLDKLSQEDLNKLLSNPEGLDRVIKLQKDFLVELQNKTKDIWTQIKDKEEIASQWVSILIILGLLQLYSFSDDAIAAKGYLILSLPSFLAVFYSIAFTLYKHPNYFCTDFFVTEDGAKDTIYKKNDAEIIFLKKIFTSLSKNYERKKKVSKYISPSIIVNFSLSILFLICYYVLEITISIPVYLLIALISLVTIYCISRNGSNGSFSFTYKQDKFGTKIISDNK